MNCIERQYHAGRPVDVACFYAMKTCRGNYLVPFRDHGTPTLVHYCLEPACPAGGKHYASYQYVCWGVPS
jgi:hypothetical protein